MNENIRLKFITLLKDVNFLIENHTFSILRKREEKDPESIAFVYPKKPKQADVIKSPSGILFKEQISKEERNFLCRLCIDRLSGIRTFKRNGRKKILVLHYTGETKKGRKLFVKKSKYQVFRTKEAETIFEKLIQKTFGFSYLEFFYQEYLGCNFLPDSSNNSDWLRRAENCKSQVKETLEEDEIVGVIMLGSSAVLSMGIEKAKKIEGHIEEYSYNGKKIPQIVIRSPEAILQIQEKKKKIQIESDDYKTLQNEEEQLFQKLYEQLTQFKTYTGL
ncbi:MAG: hypothetical protein L6Q54_00995 [Leptospiraceae bacterium]|nr:hypothetical protein [Leptospiraceae bacterium]MCK6379815.1 hypothetical protein [Leptospiraceae bacterium]NUM41385.1 hypothetical protein [Leptospiraceae bacterium]